jgi:hypothetical protein
MTYSRTSFGVPAVAVTGTLAAQPTAATFGKGFYFATDDNGGTLYYSNGTSWSKQAPGVSPGGDAVAGRHPDNRLQLPDSCMALRRIPRLM